MWLMSYARDSLLGLTGMDYMESTMPVNLYYIVTIRTPLAQVWNSHIEARDLKKVDYINNDLFDPLQLLLNRKRGMVKVSVVVGDC